MNEYNERLLKNVLEDYCEEKDKEFIKESEEATNDPRFARTPEKDAAFEKMLNKEMKKVNRKASAKKNLIRAASIFLAVCLGFTVMTSTVQGFKEKVWNFFANFGSQTHFSLHTTTDDNEKMLDKYEGKYIPSFIPDGYIIENVKSLNEIYYIEMSKDGKSLSFIESDKDSSIGVDDEQTDSYEEISINGEQAIKSEKNGAIYLTLKKEESLIYIMTTDEKIDIVGFAELIEEK